MTRKLQFPLNNTKADRQRITFQDIITTRRRVFSPNKIAIPQSRRFFGFSLRSSDTIDPNAHRWDAFSESMQTMLASEAVLRREWDDPEEDAAWADL